VAKILTAASVLKFKATRERRVIRDAAASSLYLVVQPSGSKSWLMRFRTPSGRVGKLTLGSVDLSGRELEGEPQIGMPLSLVAARQLAAEVHRRRALGRDVVAEHKAKRRLGPAGANTFGQLVRKYVAEHARPKTRNWRDTARMLGLSYPKTGDGEPEEIEGGLAQRWASRDAGAVTEHDVWSVVEEARSSAIPGIEPLRKDEVSDVRAGLFFSAVSGLFGWLKKRRLIDSNPALGISRPEPPPARDRVLTSAELKKVWAAAEQLGPPFEQIVWMLVLTGCRAREVAEMRRDELSDDGSTWTIPGARTKNHRAHVLVLPALAAELVRSAPAISAEFTFSATGKGPAALSSKIKKKLDGFAGIAPWRVHDLRRTAATGMADVGIAPHVVEAVLNHVSGSKGGIAGVYNRSAYGPEKTAALARWAAHVEGLVSEQPSRVVPIRGRK
jgi:integrase